MKARCDGCDRTVVLTGEPGGPSDLIHLSLYVNGSEGVWLCLECRMMLTTIIRNMRRAVGEAKLRSALERKESAG
jgi:hypothetical protein